MIGRFLRRYGWRYVPGILFLVLSSYVQALAPLYLGRAIDELAASPIDRAAVFRQIGYILLVALGTFLTRFIWRAFIIGNARNLECFLREELFDHLQRMPVDFFNHQKTGDLIAYAINDVNAVRMTFGQGLSQFLTGVGLGIFSISTMAAGVQPTLTAIALIPIPFALVAVYCIGQQVQRRFRRVQELFAEVSGTVQENLAGMRVIKAFAQEEDQIEHFTGQSDTMRQANINLVRTSSMIEPLIKVLFGVSYLITMVYGAPMVLKGTISLGAFVAFNGYLLMIMQPVISVGRVVNLLQRGMASFKRLNAVIGAPSIPESEQADLKDAIDGALEARSLTFTYPSGGAPVLRNISFRVEPGQVLGIVGPTGSGKTTLTHLLMKFYDTPEGMLFVDGRDVTELPARGLRRQIAYVPQDGFLFNATVEENIRFYEPGRSRADVERAAEMAGLAKDLSSFAEGYETMAGERGNHLSGGQKQRVAIARALIRDPRLIVLDDALSAVDNETEKMVLHNLNAFFPGRTAVVIAHRLSSVEHADLILYLEDGEVRERGSHAELLARDGAYAALWRKQMSEGREEA